MLCLDAMDEMMCLLVDRSDRDLNMSQEGSDATSLLRPVRIQHHPQ